MRTLTLTIDVNYGPKSAYDLGLALSTLGAALQDGSYTTETDGGTIWQTAPKVERGTWSVSPEPMTLEEARTAATQHAVSRQSPAWGDPTLFRLDESDEDDRAIFVAYWTDGDDAHGLYIDVPLDWSGATSRWINS